MSATLAAAVHFGQDYLENLHSTKNQTQRTMRQFFDVTKKLITDQREIQGISMIDWYQRCWQMTTLLTDKAVHLSTAKVQFSIVSGQDGSKSHKRMEGESRMVYDFSPMSRIGSNRRGADGVRVEKFPRIHYIANPRRDPEKDNRNAV